MTQPARKQKSILANGATASAGSFTPAFFLALILGLAAAVIIAPLTAAAVAAAGFRFPFPRIFDRTVIATLAAAVILFAHRLQLVELLRNGFANSPRPARQWFQGFAIAIAAMVALFAIAIIYAGAHPAVEAVLLRAVRFTGPAIIIGIFEEGFFRAFMLGGMTHDLGRAGALVASAAFFAAVHLVRSPAHFYVSGIHPAVGLDDLGASAARLIHPGNLIPMVFGLFLLGIVLGEAFLLTGRVWASAGMHAAVVIGAKTWPVIAHAGARPPRWLAGPGPVPLIAAPAAWIAAIAMALALLALFGPLGRGRTQSYIGGNPRGRVR
jgi:membrane protease YdiL (CAAX protease family)